MPENAKVLRPSRSSMRFRAVKLLIFLHIPPMKIILFSRPQVILAAEEICQLFEAIRQFGFDYAVNEEFAEEITRIAEIEIPPEKRYTQQIEGSEDAAIMVCYGGDGTLLEGVHRLGNKQIPVMGINAGHLGFLTSAPSAGVKSIFREIAAGRITTQPRTMLSITGDFPGGKSTQLALNEFAVQRQGAGMIAVETCVDDQMVATYHGDGVIVSTPTGSTAYSLSAGGPVVVPTCQCLVISPLAPHNLTMRPIVVPDSSRITLHVRPRHSDAFLTLDNRTFTISDHATFTVRRAEQPIFLAVPHNISFYDTLRNKMMWGIDIRS